MNIQLSRRVARIVRFLPEDMRGRLAFLARIERAASFDALTSTDQALIVAAEAEQKKEA
jgi:hypothetical protein